MLESLCPRTLTFVLLASVSHALQDGVEVDTVSEEQLVHRTYFILYKGDTQSPNTVNCTTPPGSNVTQEATHVTWESPSGNAITPVAAEDDNIDVDEPEVAPVPSVKLTPDNVLVFYSPDDSLHGPYTCRGMKEERVVYTTIVYVHVLKKYVFETENRLKIGFLSAGLFFLFIGLCFLGMRIYGRYFSEYTMAPRDEIPFSVQVRSNYQDKSHSNDVA